MGRCPPSADWSTRPTLTGWQTTACAIPTCTPRRSVRRRAPACSPGATIIPTVWRAITEFATGYPGYDGRMPFENGMLSEMLLENGYNTFCTGKWHLNPAEEGTPAGPYHRWPLGRGFERFYGFLGGETNQWFPDLTYDNHSVPQPKSVEEGYHLTEDLSDKAIQFILDAHVNAPDKPFFLYHATGAAHAPHQVGQEWIDKYKGKFDMGWDKYREIVFENQKKLGIFPANAELSRHDPDVPAWDTSER